MNVESDTMGAIPAELDADTHPTEPQTNIRFADHLDKIFQPLRFPPELARRILTHGSHKEAAHGHNARLSFLGEPTSQIIAGLPLAHVSLISIGRRVLEAYLLLFLHSTSTASRKFDAINDHDIIIQRCLNTYLLGEHVAPKWRLERIIRWAPTVSANRLISRAVKSAREKDGLKYIDEQDPGEVESWVDVKPLGRDVVKSVGMHKVHGDIVQGIMGGIFHQFVRTFLFSRPHLLSRLPMINRAALLHTVHSTHASSLVSSSPIAPKAYQMSSIVMRWKFVSRWAEFMDRWTGSLSFRVWRIEVPRSVLARLRWIRPRNGGR
jgi:hypothetical protein